MRRMTRCLMVVLAVLAMPASAQQCLELLGETVAMDEVASGRLLYRTGDRGRFVAAPVQQTDVEITVRGLLAEAVVTQRFANPTEQWLEGVYVFPLPASSAVHAMRLVIGERVIEGRIEERAAARKMYETAKQEGRKASLVEQERPNIFTTSVANVGPGESVEVRLEYHQELTFTAEELELRFPMVIGPRYIPGTLVRTVAGGAGGAGGAGWTTYTDQVPDASRITPPVVPPGAAAVNPVTLRVVLEAGFPLSRLVSPYHPVRVAQRAAGMVEIELDGPVPADRDFVLRWAPERGEGPRAAAFVEEWNGEHYVVAMLLPPAERFTGAARLPRELVFVVDTSGSMAGASIVQAKAALDWALSHLAPEDYFNIIEFDSTFTVLFPESRPAMPAAVDEARAWVLRLGARGGTEMAAALSRALEDREQPTTLRQVVFITDGCVGNEQALFALVEHELGRSRLFTVGIGSAPNGHFMQRAATFGRGTYTFIGAPEEVEPRMRALFTRIENPVLAGLELVWPDPSAEMWPERVPDLYAGEPVVVAARLGTVVGGLEMSGVIADATWRAHLPLATGAQRAGVHRLWARRKIAALMDERARGSSEEEVRARVLPVALEHHLVSQYTSLVAVDVTPTRPDGEALRTGQVPTNLPAGWQHEAVFGVMPQGGTPGRLHLLASLLLASAGIALHWLKGGRR